MAHSWRVLCLAIQRIVTQWLMPLGPFKALAYGVFLSVGLLIDPVYMWNNMGKIAVLLVLVAVGKTILNASILHAFKKPWSVGFLSSLMLAQIGEFSFVWQMLRQILILKGNENSW